VFTWLYSILSVDTFPGYICGGRPREIDGAVLNSGHSSVYSDTLCVTRFVSDDDLFTSKRLMLKFEMFSITDPNFELTILGTSGSAVCFLLCTDSGS